ncbi:MAG: NYN domain-containing protein [Nitrospirae bacterium]|nr:NYN domain-containing protein [Nitrospirota bacterium]
MEKARHGLIEILIEYKLKRSHDITVVFDGHKSGAAAENVSARGGVKIIYSKLGERADDVIKRIVSAQRKEWIVVSSDRDIANHAWHVNSIPVSSEKFYERVLGIVKKDLSDKTAENSPRYFKDEDDECLPDYKGSAYQPSKKDKLIKKALAKL